MQESLICEVYKVNTLHLLFCFPCQLSYGESIRRELDFYFSCSVGHHHSSGSWRQQLRSFSNVQSWESLCNKKMYFQFSKSFVPVVNLVKVACLVFPGSRGASRS